MTVAPTAADDDDGIVNYVDEYDLASAASLFVGFRNRFWSYHLIPWTYLILRS